MSISKKPKILFLPSWYPNLTNRYTGIFIRRHAVAVSAFNPMAVLFACSNPNLQNKTYQIDINNDTGFLTIIVYYKKVTSNIPLFSGLLKLYRFLIAYHKGYKIILKQFGKPDIVHLNVIFPVGIIALFLNLFYKIPLIVSEQWSGYLPESGKYKLFFQKNITQFVIHKASAITTVSEALKNAMQNHRLKNNYHIVPNVVETMDSSRLKNIENNIVKILVVCDLTNEVKNVSDIIKVAALLAAESIDFTIEIIGDGKDKTMLENLAKEKRILNKNVFFAGEMSNEDIYEKMLCSDFLILNSNYETFSCVIAESFSCGTPVIATNAGAIPELVNDNTGILIEPKNMQQLTEAIRYMMRHHKKFDKLKLHQHVQSRFSYQVVGKQISDIYESVMKFKK